MAHKKLVDLEALLKIVDDPESVPQLRQYFGIGYPPYTGGRFERLAGGGDRPETQNIVTTDDLVAVEMLSVQVPPRVSLALLEGDLGPQISEELGKIPTDVCLGDDGAAAHVADDSPAGKAWRLLTKQHGVDWVIAGKVLGRKRPKLIPVYDGVVSCAFGTSKGFWLWLDGKLREDGGTLGRRLAELRAEAGLPDEISAIRVLDVVVWMRHHEGHAKKGCPGLS